MTMYAIAWPPPASSVNAAGVTRVVPAAFASLSLTHLYGDRAGTPPTNTRPPRSSLCATNFLTCLTNASPPAAATSRDWIVFASSCAARSIVVAASITAVTLADILPRSRSCFPALLLTYSGCAKPIRRASSVKNSSKRSVTPTTSNSSINFSKRVQSSSVTLAWHSGAWGCTPTLLSAFPSILTASSATAGSELATSASTVFASTAFASTHSTSYPGCRICPVHLSPSNSRVCMSCTLAAHSPMSRPHAAFPGTSGHPFPTCSALTSPSCCFLM
mmetsp:Transcript_1951/g.7561  ORF Transcript_1951/g.7561 Transcript_1951/m.7561 type:complete len:275 (-) Transcript_1951:1054-1878(-)